MTAPIERRCATCRHFRRWLESAVPGVPSSGDCASPAHWIYAASGVRAPIAVTAQYSCSAWIGPSAPLPGAEQRDVSLGKSIFDALAAGSVLPGVHPIGDCPQCTSGPLPGSISAATLLPANVVNFAERLLKKRSKDAR